MPRLKLAVIIAHLKLRIELETEMILVGDFVQNYMTNGTTLQQASGIVGYDPATDTFTSNFGGIMLSSEATEVYFTLLKSTPMFVIFFTNPLYHY